MSPFFLGTAPFVSGEIFETIEKYALQTDDCKGAFAKYLDIHSLSELELLVQEGHTNDRMYWVESGLVRSFYAPDTDDITTGLYQEGDFFCAFSSFFSQKPSTESICTEEPSVLYSIRFEDLQWLFGLYPELNHAFCGLYGHLLELHHTRTSLLHYRTPHERYEAFLAQYPHLPNRLKVKHIASYLGIHRVTLCKIRKQLTHKKR